MAVPTQFFIKLPTSRILHPRLAPTIRACRQRVLMSFRAYSDAHSDSTGKQDDSLDSTENPVEEVKQKQKTQAQLDKELLAKLQGLDGDGGAAAIEYEDGKPVSMKRSVKNNMFRYI